MSRRWNWDFEDDPPAARRNPPAAGPRPPGPGPSAAHARRRARFRRRRVGAGLALVLLIALIVALSASHHGGSASTARPRVTHGSALPPGTPKSLLADERRAVDATLAYTPFVREGGGRGRDIALTFDDGPGPYTPGVLAALEQAHTRATFFPIGRMERYFGASTVRQIRDGDVIGNHTENHPEMARLSPHEQHEELVEGEARVELAGGPRPQLFRPPYGSFNAVTMRELQRQRLLMVLWSVDTGDYEQPGVPVIIQRVLEGAHPGAIMLLHDGGGDRAQTVAALPGIIRALRARGYRLVTVPQLLMDDPPPRGLPLPPNLSGD